jgi:hypothetical protein
MSWDSDAAYEEEVEYAYAMEREAELEEAEERKCKARMDAFDAALDAYEAEQYGPIYFIPAEDLNLDPRGEDHSPDQQ